ncbi:MAG TPA: PAS domain S-box protein [Vicinamibacterales bacterium]|nr:PAS domain S-box protein [Vicinamibacterales bacterium]
MNEQGPWPAGAPVVALAPSEGAAVVLDELDAVVWTRDVPTGRFLFVSRAVQRLLGYAPADWCGDATFWEARVLHPDDRDAVTNAIVRARGGEQKVALEYRLRAADGRVVWVRDGMRRVGRREGAGATLQGVLVDVTERKALEARLQRRERQLLESQQLAHIGSWEWDLATDAIHWSDELFRIWGLEPAGTFSYPDYLARLHPDDRARQAQTIARALADGGSFETEHRATMPDGSVRWIYGRGEVVAGPDGRPAKVRGISQDITERRRGEERMLQLVEERIARERLQRERENLRRLFQQAPAIIAVLRGPDLVVDLANEAFLEMAGCPADRLVGVPLRDTATNLDLHPLLERAADVHRTGQLEAGRAVPVRIDRDGDGVAEDEAFFDLAYQPLREDDAVTGVMIYAVDVTTQVRARRAEREHTRLLQRSQARHEGILNSAIDCIVTMDAQGRIAEFNPAAEQVFGYRRDEVVGRDMADLLVPERYRDAHRHGLARQLATGQSNILGKRVELSALRRDGTEFPVELAVTRIDDVVTPLFTAYLRDISERKAAERRLLDNSRQASLMADIGLGLTRSDDLKVVLQQCAQAVVDRLGAAFARIWTLDPAAGILELQASAGLYTRLDGTHGRIPVGSYKIGLIAERRTPHLTNDVIGDPQVVNQAWAKREGMVAFAGFPLMIGTELVGVLGMFARHALSEADFQALAIVAHGIALGIARARGIDALKDSEARYRERAEDLTRLATALERSNRELDAFAYAASHDLRAPLRGIANLAQWIEEDLQGSIGDDTREMLDLLRNRMHRMEALIDGILQYSRAGRVHQQAERLDVSAIVREVVDLLSPESAIVTIDDDLPVVVSERLPLRQVFHNLIGNAVKHGGPGVQVRVSAREAGAFWEFRVEDDGEGIPPEYHDRIWGMFQMLETRDKVEGTGIGLALVKKLVEAQGGRIWVDSTPGHGATFRFLWARAPAEAA